ncbi:MAG: hypothetical protein KGV50_04725 [Gammaproteobacteria bacterium]|nr:hypothetical protein [Gammaproteobacteria bacterium]
MKKTLSKKRFAFATTAALLLTGCASDSSSESDVFDDGEMGQCHGVNSCKGTSSCAVAGKNSCASQNSCQGKGWMPLTKSSCDERGGKFKGFKKISN